MADLIVPPDLVVAAQGGDALAVDELIGRLAPVVGRVCHRVAPEVAEDARQEALVAVLRDLPGLRVPEAAVAWAATIASRVAARMAQRRRSAPGPLTVEPAVGHAELGVEIADVLDRLGDDQRHVIVLRYALGWSEQQVAAALRLPVGTVKSRLSRASAAFRAEWAR
jgi:RNA polymerase sigma factor (sigma-70 family)